MDVKDYCSSLEIELTGWKAKLYDAIVKTEKLSGKHREKILANIGDMKTLISDLEDRIYQLKTECPAKWSPEKKKIDKGHIDMRAKYEETMEYIGKASPVSIPG
jgi:SHS2 domain-containing protein